MFLNGNGDREIGTRTQAIRLLRKKRSCDEASNLVENFEKMATDKAENIVARLEAKIDANAKLQNTKYNVLIGILSALLIAALVGRFSF